MADKSIAEKMFIKKGEHILLVNPPKGYEKILKDLPEGALLASEGQPDNDSILCFLNSKIEMEQHLPLLKTLLKPAGKLWIAYPKGISKIHINIHRDIIARYALGIGLQAVAMIAIDETWSALRLKIIS